MMSQEVGLVCDFDACICPIFLILFLEDGSD